MATSIATQNPTFHALSTDVPVGHKQVFVRGGYAGTVTTVTRCNTNYWAVSVRTVRGAFSGASVSSVTAQVWLHPASGRWVADYSQADGYVEIAESRDLLAALGLAIWSAGDRGHTAGRW